MITIHQLHLILNQEQLKLILPVFEQRDLVIQSFRLMRKDYANVKSRIRQIEKKLHTTITDIEEYRFIIHNITHQISCIENKYKDIEHATRQYKQSIKYFNSRAGSVPALINSLNGYGPSVVNHLTGPLSSANGYINSGADAIRITQRYFNNISSAFASHKKLAQAIRQRNIRLAKIQQQNPPA